MPWVRFDDQFPIHRKVKGLSDAAFRLHVDAIFWCARNLTDGFVSTEDVSDLATGRRPHKLIPELVARGNWVERDGGWDIHDYLDFQPSKAKVQTERKAKAERQRRWLDKQQKGGKKDASIDASTKERDASKDATRDASIDAAPYPPRPEKGGGGNAPGRASPPGRSPDGAADAARQQATARLIAIANCHMCDNTGYDGRRLCDHDPQTPERNARGAALARAALQSARKEAS